VELCTKNYGQMIDSVTILFFVLCVNLVHRRMITELFFFSVSICIFFFRAVQSDECFCNFLFVMRIVFFFHVIFYYVEPFLSSIMVNEGNEKMIFLWFLDENVCVR
jgi:hypothetical protein